MKTIPAYIRMANDNESLVMALVENIQRHDLDPIEVAFRTKD
jgi:ParB family transcriptional regulator, chromosome partitioning protein